MLKSKSLLDYTNLFSPENYGKNDKIRLKYCQKLKRWKKIFVLFVASVENLKNWKSHTFFSISVFFHKHSRITGLQGKGEGISLSPHYHFHPLHRHLGISRVITAGSSPVHIAISRARTGNLWFPSESC